MPNPIFSPLDPNFENMTSDLARLEALYAEKREVESQIELALSEIDRLAMAELKSAEAEVQETNLKCAIVVARLEGADGTLLRTVHE